MKWGNLFDIINKINKIKELEEISADPDFWSNIENAQDISQNIKLLTSNVERFNALKLKYDDLITLIEITKEEEDKSILKEVEIMKDEFLQEYKFIKVDTLLKGEYDKNNTILTLHAGAGGTESCDWVNMLLRMYIRWIEKKNFTYKELDFLAGEETGIKSITIQITGENSYGYLKSEKGIHRLVRISPFDSSGKRHTTFASCDIMPEINNDIKININQDDIRIDTYRASGAGGQHVNKTSSAVRITHIKTKIVVQCQNERSQLQNKERAMNMLKAKLIDLELHTKKQNLDEIRGELKEIGFGSQIRSYVFQPYNMVKDHRTDTQTTNTQDVMNGNIDIFINDYLAKLNKIDIT